MTPNEAKFQIQPDFTLGTLVWHRADRDHCGVVKGPLITGRHNTTHVPCCQGERD